MKCLFCEDKNIIIENNLAYIRMVDEGYNVSKGHALAIPHRHVENFFDITKEEREAMFSLIDAFKKVSDEKYSPDGYNIGANCGKVAGQTVMHAHMHIIPRYIGDVKEASKSGIEKTILSLKENK